ncbi:1-acyl dihydroxyacetone phosphate reductase [Penicillium angulare]|uniref:1-acyl dihydroxyacetone phosphate reductase n=1 Tax=Penicillium angulare TaxID=116970 RepID=UPI002541C9F3|nr:1-acyl dihydroxyacetone phosphate reductase [Penicillium angulare]KAJ5273544.1 1-acyl dihydroxyacetone phosphate reductase [Penicillium angulare]
MPQKTVLVTGCSAGGLGEAMAKVYHQKGFRVFAAVRNMAKVGYLSEIEGIEIVKLDVTSAESIRECATSIGKNTGGSLDILVNNAGLSTVFPLLDTSIEEAKKLFDTNVWALVAMAQAFAPMLIKSKGTICNVSSVSGEMVFAWQGKLRNTHEVFLSSRSATTRISETLRLEMEPLGVRVVTLILGGVQTIRNDATKIPDLELPANSYYQNILSIIDRHHKVLVHPNKANIDAAAANVVNDVLGSSGFFIRRGAASTLSWFCNTFLPYGIFISMINKESGLSDVGFSRNNA